MNMMSNQFPHPQPELVQYPLPILRTEGLLFFFLMIHIFASAPLPPLFFSFSPPSSLFLSSLLVLCRPAAALCCRDGLRDVTEGWSGPLIGAGGGEKWGED